MSTNLVPKLAPNPAAKRLLKQVGMKPPVVPAGHVVAVAYARVFGPKMKADPSGHPIQIGSGLFDLNVTTPQEAIAVSAKHWHGIEVATQNWEVIFEEDVIHPRDRPAYPFSKLYVLRYLPEVAMWKHRGLTDDNVPNHFKNSHWLTKNWQKTARVKA